ncbi:hypothetical protein ASG89_06200 [Paenibacillus sp. Soil766]|uniref:hypothetical protein n=1 Tax=Paenibacillus sp. Soil766 TaxID=1736404 RepID=UPI00070CD51E|nr:hypothetical protein [Paenibacillus sp. Soil766]KRE93096.1 hypothetical protein ASG89_06200 [Paenibacillus sp. Soil766]
MLEWVMLLYMALCTVVIGYRHRRDKREAVVRIVLVVGFPIVGFMLPAFRTERWHQRSDSRHERARSELFEDILVEKATLTNIVSKLETEKEMNIVPLEEALLVNDLSTRRRVMIDLLKQDSLDYLEVLQMAVSNEDTETSHYAVSAIMEVKRKIVINLQELAVKFEENKRDAHVLLAYSELLKSYMRSGFLDERTRIKYSYTYSNVLKLLIEVAPESAEAYADKIKTDLDLEEFAEAEETAQMYLKQFPLYEDAYLSLINVYYTMRAIDKLKLTLMQLRQSPIRLSNQALTVVRFWSEEKVDEKSRSQT